MALFVWDYHGTLERGNESAVLELSNMALQAAGFSERLTASQATLLCGQPWIKYFATVLPDQPADVHKSLYRDVLAIDTAQPQVKAKHIRANDDSHAVLGAIAAAGHSQVIISHCNDIAVFLRLTGMERYFPPGHHFSTHATLPSQSKQQLFDAYLHGKRFDRIILIGDSPADLVLSPHDKEYLYAHPGIPMRDAPTERTIKIRNLLDVVQEL